MTYNEGKTFLIEGQARKLATVTEDDQVRNTWQAKDGKKYLEVFPSNQFPVTDYSLEEITE